MVCGGVLHHFYKLLSAVLNGGQRVSETAGNPQSWEILASPSHKNNLAQKATTYMDDRMDGSLIGKRGERRRGKCGREDCLRGNTESSSGPFVRPNPHPGPRGGLGWLQPNIWQGARHPKPFRSTTASEGGGGVQNGMALSPVTRG